MTINQFSMDGWKDGWIKPWCTQLSLINFRVLDKADKYAAST